MKHNIAGLLIGMVIATAASYPFSSIRDDYIKVTTDIETDVFVASVRVPDFRAGENPPISYENTKIRPFVGKYSIEIKTIQGQTVYKGRAKEWIDYTPDDKIAPENQNLDWFAHPPDEEFHNNVKSASEEIKNYVQKFGDTDFYITWSFEIKIDGVELPTYRPQPSNVFKVRK